MRTEFVVVDTLGNAIVEGEQEGDIYRVFTKDKGTLEFDNVSDLHEQVGGSGIQLRLLNLDEPRQLTLFGGTSNERDKTPK